MPTVVTTLKRHSVLADVLPGSMPGRRVAEPCLNGGRPGAERWYARSNPNVWSHDRRRDAAGSGVQIDRLAGEVPV